MKFNYFLFLSILLNVNCFGQKNYSLITPLSMVKSFDTSLIYEMPSMKYDETYVSLKSIQLKNFAVFKYPVNGTQLIFDNYKSGLMSDSIFKLIVKQKKLNVRSFENANYDHYLLVMLGILADGTFIIIPDINNNNDFNDDPIFDYDHNVPDILKVENIMFTNIHYFTGKETRDLNILYDLIIHPNVNKIEESKVFLKRCLYWRGCITYQGLKEDFIIDLISSGFDFKTASDIRTLMGNNLQVEYFVPSYKNFYSIADTIEIGPYRIKLDSVSTFGNFAYFNILEDTSINFSIKNFIKKLSGREILKDSMVSILGDKKFTLLDFWASWCQPCLEQHKILQKMQPLFSQKKISLTGIIIDDNVNKPQSIEHIIREKIDWTNVFVPKDQERIQGYQHFNVDILPMYFLIDNKTGNIIFRSQSVEKTLLLLNSLM